MKTFTERDFITYPRQFKAYKWYKPILAGLLLLLFIIYADRKLHWFDEVKKDDVTAFNEKSR
jgi:hypothetical protein